MPNWIGNVTKSHAKRVPMGVTQLHGDRRECLITLKLFNQAVECTLKWYKQMYLLHGHIFDRCANNNIQNVSPVT